MPGEYLSKHPDYRIAKDKHETFSVVHEATHEIISHHEYLGEARAAAREYQRMDNARRMEQKKSPL